MDQEHTISVSRRTVRLALAFAVVLAVLAPIAVVAAGGTFIDDDTSIFEDDIEWLVANGVTSGCGADTYCPEDNVTRGQMAAFMHRLATNKVVDAATADSATSADSATEADTAQNARLIDGLDSTDFALGVVEFFDTTGGSTLTSGSTATSASVTVDVPRRCSLLHTESVEVLVIATGYMNSNSAAASVSTYLYADGVETNPSFVRLDLDDTSSRTPFSTQWLYEVEPGEHTFEVSQTNIGPSAIEVWYPKLSAQVMGSECDSIVVLPSEPAAKDLFDQQR
ncbi:MAG: S-layer homology domain-containing protein [bacterium]|nr:S-layer homology domain-containing protein [bacterium]MCP4968847.1 S-layer homology domain-containing protein [bacterium]